MILTLGMQHQGLKFYKVYINDDPVLTLTYLRIKSLFFDLHGVMKTVGGAKIP